MKLNLPENMGYVAGLCCRQSPVRGLVGSLVVCAFVMGAVFLCWHKGFPFVRIAWRGHGNDVVPPLTRVLDELSRRVKVDEPTHTDRADWNELSEAELEELVAQLVRSGDDLAAAQLLIRRHGCSETEAHKFVEEQASRILG